MSHEDDTDGLLARIVGGGRRHAPPQRGTRRFEIVRKLGSGTFGEVYEARDREHGNVVALKALKSSHPDWIYRFKREFRIAGELAHPNVVRMFELFVEDDRWYLTMELIDGIRLDDHLARAPGAVASCFGQLAHGLAALHRAGCLHRDVKPSNALVTGAGQVVLLDFGLALHQQAAIASVVAGTARYMAPELGLHQPATEASDWYSFGVMLYEALAGEPPFAGDEAEMLRAKLATVPSPPSDLRNGVDPTLEALALGLLQRDPTARPAVGDVLHALGAPGDLELNATVFVGRDAELARLQAAFEDSRTRSVVVAISGVAGVGKSALIEAFISQLRIAQIAVFQGRCLEHESVPYKGVDGALDELCHDLSRRRLDDTDQLPPADVAALVSMLPMAARISAITRIESSGPDPRTAVECRRAAIGVLRALIAPLGPVVLVVDDLQWAGVDTIDLLGELLASSAPLLLVVSHRTPAPSPIVIVERFHAELATRALDVIALDLEPLDRASIETWMASTPIDGGVDHAIDETGGHPGLLARILTVSREDGKRIGLAAVLARTLELLSPQERYILELVAAAQRPTSARAVFAAAELRFDPAMLDQLRRRRLLQGLAEDEGVTIDTYHPRIRSALLAGLSAQRLQELAARLPTA